MSKLCNCSKVVHFIEYKGTSKILNFLCYFSAILQYSNVKNNRSKLEKEIERRKFCRQVGNASVLSHQAPQMAKKYTNFLKDKIAGMSGHLHCDSVFFLSVTEVLKLERRTLPRDAHTHCIMDEARGFPKWEDTQNPFCIKSRHRRDVRMGGL